MTQRITCPSPWAAAVFSVIACLLVPTLSAGGDSRPATESPAAQPLADAERYVGRFKVSDGRWLRLELREGNLWATAEGEAPWSLPIWPGMPALETDPPTAIRHARGFLRTTSRGQSAAALALCAERFLAETDPDELVAIWKGFEEEWGKYQAMAPFALNQDGEIDRVSLVVEFERQLVHFDVEVQSGEGVVSWSESSQVPQRTVELQPAADGTFFVDASRWQLPNPRVVFELESEGEAVGVEIRGSEG